MLSMLRSKHTVICTFRPTAASSAWIASANICFDCSGLERVLTGTICHGRWHAAAGRVTERRRCASHRRSEADGVRTLLAYSVEHIAGAFLPGVVDFDLFCMQRHLPPSQSCTSVLPRIGSRLQPCALHPVA